MEERPSALELVEIVASHLERACGLLRVSRQPPVGRRRNVRWRRSRHRRRGRSFGKGSTRLSGTSRVRSTCSTGSRLSAMSSACGARVSPFRSAAGRGRSRSQRSGRGRGRLARRSPNERARALVWLANVHVKQSRPDEASACLDAAVDERRGAAGTGRVRAVGADVDLRRRDRGRARRDRTGEGARAGERGTTGSRSKGGCAPDSTCSTWAGWTRRRRSFGQ